MRPAGAFGLMAGAVTGFLALLLAGEFFLRLAPPDDLRPYLGAESGLSGAYVADPVLGADYRSYSAFAELNAARLAQLRDDNQGRPVWAMFGNSFVQAVGMLGDTAQAELPDHQIFYLKRNEPIYLRVAQFRQLLDNGLRPERAFFILLPIDIFGVAVDPATAVEITPDGAIGRKVRKPYLLAPILDHSWLALAAWTRSGRSRLLPDFRAKDVLEPPPELVVDELGQMLGAFADVAARHQVKATVVFIPNKEQIFDDTRTAPQDIYRAAAGRLGLDFVDVTPALLAESDRSGLLIADGHLSARGNKILLATILAHLDLRATADRSP